MLASELPALPGEVALAVRAQASHGLMLFAPPLALPEIVFHLIWHRRSDSHPAQRWFREFIAEQAVDL